MSLLEMTFSGAVLIVLIAFLRLLLRRAVPKRTFLVLWAVALARLLVPFSPTFELPLALPTWERAPVEQAVTAVTLPEGAVPAVDDLAYALETLLNEDASPTEEERQAAMDILQRKADRAAPAAEPERTPRPVWRIVWLAGTLACGAAFGLLYILNYRRFHGAVPVGGKAAAAWLAAHPLRRTLAIRTMAGVNSPLTYGVLRPVILVPEGFDFADSAARYALEHEYVHARRFDAAFKPLLAAALAIHWCNPAVWLMYVLANRDVELSCDEAVLRRFGENERAPYARALLSMEERRGILPPVCATFGANTTKERIVSIMKFRKRPAWSLALAAALVLGLAACAVSGTRSGVETPVEPTDTPAPAPTGELPDGAAFLNGGMTLTVPAEYRDLVLVDMPQNAEYGTLFVVSEKASVEAAEAEGHEDWGMGWLFSIERVSKAELDEWMTADMSGVSVFAKDEDGNCYIRSMPTDVRYYRNEDAIVEDSDGWAQWEKLQRWTGTVRATFLAENPSLTPFSVTNSGVDIYLARLACWDDIEYTLGSVAFGPLSPDGVDAAPYVERLRNGVTFETVDSSQTPSGEFFALNFPDSGGGERFDFFAAGGNYVRQVYGPNGEYEILYKATYADGTTESSEIVAEWYFALAAANGLPAEEPAWIVSLP